MLHSERAGTGAEPISPAKIHARFPEAAQWLRSASDLSLTTHLHAASVWFRAARAAGWNPERIPLEPVDQPALAIRNGKGSSALEEPFKSIVIGRVPLRSPSRVDLTIVGRTMNGQASAAIEAAFRKWWPDLSISIRKTEILRDRLMEPPAIGVLMIPDNEDIYDSPWIDWLRASEAAGHRFRIVRESTLRSSSACTNLAFDLFMLAGGIPWTAAVSERDGAVLGLDAGHDRDRRRSRWVCSRVEIDENAISCSIVGTELAEHLPGSAIDRLLPEDRARRALTVFRDGRFHTESRQEISPNGMTVSVVKHPRAVLYRNRDGKLHPARFGDALIYPDSRLLLQTSSNRDTVSGWKMPIRIGVNDPNLISRATSLTTLLCRQPALGVFHQPRLPAPVYWADLISKTTADGWPKVVGRGLGLESIIPERK
ncbi:hypothetical protein HFP89_08110 [Wenzhouxiangella sp. XN79A]|uniref:hypothetical protein n=1 Tax=Wenzhouxiangella sp. XN79A TaxID=2724193 RepID=UPI00144A8245|nr:hypothetical protein [Wenzhouxiangella sp. XN79A]NKI35128.1 hypothetical protein [Wenzhouxiangella sp. XN79A]